MSAIIIYRELSIRGDAMNVVINVYGEYKGHARLFKALSDPNRLVILDMLSRGELCARVILEKLNITQPTLSHHMKSLCGCKLVKWRKEGKWTHYSLNEETVKRLRSFLNEVTLEKENW